MLHQIPSHNLFSDAFFIKDEKLLFASVYGRNSNISSLIGQLSTNTKEYILNSIGFTLDAAVVHPLGKTARHFDGLTKKVTKISTSNFGVLNHLMMINTDLIKIDLEKASAWVVREQMIGDDIWPVVKSLSSLPLLDAWSEEIVSRLCESENIQYFMDGVVSRSVTIIGLNAAYVSLPEDFEILISSLVKSHVLDF